jgi:cytoskeleton protein RodZ
MPPEPAPSIEQAAVPTPERTPMPTTTWPAPKQETAAVPITPPPAVAVPTPPPLVVMSVPSIGQAQAAQPPANERTPGADPQEATARGAVEQSNVAVNATLPVKSDTQIIARTNSWIELRSPGGDVLAQSYVRAGESYTVPAGISYRLTAAH